MGRHLTLALPKCVQLPYLRHVSLMIKINGLVQLVNLTFDLAGVTLTFKLLSGLCLGIHKVSEIDSWMGHCLGSLGMLNHCRIFNLISTKVYPPAIFKTSFSYHKDIWIAGTDYLLLFVL